MQSERAKKGKEGRKEGQAKREELSLSLGSGLWGANCKKAETRE